MVKKDEPASDNEVKIEGSDTIYKTIQSAIDAAQNGDTIAIW